MHLVRGKAPGFSQGIVRTPRPQRIAPVYLFGFVPLKGTGWHLPAAGEAL